MNNQTLYYTRSGSNATESTRGSIWFSTRLLEKAIKDNSGVLLKSTTLHQNYPNPFNPITRIDFDLPEDGQARLIVYDLMGREVTRLVDNRLSAGYHSASWNASNVASGIYFYRLTSGDFIQTKKMVFLK